MTASAAGRAMIIGVDRLDYSKGLDLKFEAYQRFLRPHASWCERATFLQITPKSRSAIAEYAAMEQSLDSISGRINSVHHQGVKDVAPGFAVEAVSPEDGVVEAIRRTDGPWVAAVQWHPEFHRPELGVVDDTPLLRDFLAAARSARSSPGRPKTEDRSA